MKHWEIGVLGKRVSPQHSILPLFHSSGLDHLLEEFLLFEGHLSSPFFRPLMLIANQVEHPMDHQEDDHFHIVKTEPIRLALGRLHRNDQVSEKMGMKGRELSLPHGEGEDIGRFVPTEVSSIQRLNLEIVDKQETDLSLKKPQFGQDPLGHPSYSS
jgi:hypothetical protein